jgi:hypothetical protein
MGTSQSSNGPGASVALVPPWADAAPPDDPPPDDEKPNPTGTPVAPPPVPLAPLGRFRDARRGIGRFAKTGNSLDLRRGLGHYVRNGYGGSGTMARRMGSTATTAGRLGGVLRTGAAPDGTALQDATLATGTDANRIMDAIVEAVRPGDGTQDAEASRQAVRDALSDVLERYPNADLLDLDEAQREYVIERFTALDVYNRFRLDLEKALRAKAPDAATALSRLGQIRAFIAEHVAAAFRDIRTRSNAPTTTDVAKLARQALTETFGVFEEYLQ